MANQLEATNGWLLINKPAGIPSFGVTKTLRRLLGVKRVGHCGTLDPFADGLLPIALGEATKTIRWLEDAPKQYTFTIKWGIATHSGDPTGEPIGTSQNAVSHNLNAVSQSGGSHNADNPNAISQPSSAVSPNATNQNPPPPTDKPTSPSKSQSGDNPNATSPPSSAVSPNTTNQNPPPPTSQPTSTSQPAPSKTELTKALRHFRGAIIQTPPIYSAIKVAGTRAYKLARKGETPTLSPRQVFIKRLSLTHHTKATSTFTCVCSKGTYIRALATDIGKRLGVACHTLSLRRDAVGEFNLKNGLDFSKSIGHSEVEAALLPVEAALYKLPSVEVSSSTASLLARGVKVAFRSPEFGDVLKNTEFFRIRARGKLVAVATTTPHLRLVRVFNFGGF